MTPQDIKNRVTIVLRTEEMPDGTWSAHLTIQSLDNQHMADKALEHMQRLFCGDEIQLAS